LTQKKKRGINKRRSKEKKTSRRGIETSSETRTSLKSHATAKVKNAHLSTSLMGGEKKKKTLES